MNRHDMISGLFWLGISAFGLTKALELGVGAFSSPEPGFLLFWSSLVFAMLSMGLVAKTVIRKNGVTKVTDAWMDLNWWKPVTVMAFLFLYASFLTSLGFLLAMFALMTLLYALGRVRPPVVIAGAIVTVFLAYVIFHFGLEVRFPKGIFSW